MEECFVFSANDAGYLICEKNLETIVQRPFPHLRKVKTNNLFIWICVV